MKKVAGIGIYEKGKFPGSIKINGKTTQTKAYKDWVNICSFCGNGSYIKQQPSYAGKQLHPNWIKFQNFAEWHAANYRDGWVLSTCGDDLIGPDTSYFVPKEVAEFINPRRKPLIIGKKIIKICVTLRGVMCTFGKYTNLHDAVVVYQSLHRTESNWLAEQYDLSPACRKYLDKLGDMIPSVQFDRVG